MSALGWKADVNIGAAREIEIRVEQQYSLTAVRPLFSEYMVGENARRSDGDMRVSRYAFFEEPSCWRLRQESWQRRGRVHRAHLDQ